MAVTLSNPYGLFTMKWGNITVCVWMNDRTYAFFFESGGPSLGPPPLSSCSTAQDWCDKQNKAQLILGPFSGESTDLQLACEACKQLSRLIRTALSPSLLFPISDSVRRRWFKNGFHMARTFDAPPPHTQPENPFPTALYTIPQIQSHGDKQRKLVVHTLQTQQENATPCHLPLVRPQRRPFQGVKMIWTKTEMIEKLPKAQAVSGAMWRNQR